MTNHGETSAKVVPVSHAFSGEVPLSEQGYRFAINSKSEYTNKHTGYMYSDIVFPIDPELSCTLLQATQAPSSAKAKDIIRATEVCDAFFSVATKEDIWKDKHLSRATICNLSFNLGSLISDKLQVVLTEGDRALLSRAKVNRWRFAYEPGKMDDWKHNSIFDSEWQRTGKDAYVTNK